MVRLVPVGFGQLRAGAEGRGLTRFGKAWQGMAGKHKRQPREIWNLTRKRIWQRDSKACKRCQTPLKLNKCHIDHIVPLSKGGTNADDNLRVLCVVCHTLRSDHSHQGLIARALKKGLIPADWRPLVWDD